MSSESARGVEQEAAHDVLAAEAFAVPAADPELRQRSLTLPDDPSGIAEPHDVLAAEEFAMPAATPGPRAADSLRRGQRWWVMAGAAAALATGLALARRRGR